MRDDGVLVGGVPEGLTAMSVSLEGFWKYEA
jgi:hypothetical protein